MRRAVVLLAGTAAVSAFLAMPAGASSPEAATISASVIPIPASVTPREGRFIVRAGTPVYADRDPEARRIAGYFVDLLHTTHAITLPMRDLPAVRGPPKLAAAADLPAQAIVLRLDPQARGTSPESYQIDVSSERVLVSARDFHGLFYGAVTLWELCSMPARGANIALGATLITDTPRFRWRGLMLDS